MDDDSGGLQLRACGRKRGTGLLVKTPKKPHCETNKNDRFGKKQNCGWIQNSFGASTKPSVVLWEERDCVNEVQDAKRTATSGIIGLAQGGGNGRIHSDGAISPAVDKRSMIISPGFLTQRSNQHISSNLTSTPIQASSERVFIGSDTPESQNYATQYHESFNESDSAFADLDLRTFDGPNRSRSLRRARRKVSAAHFVMSSTSRRSSTQKQSRGAREKERFKRQSQNHPISALQRDGDMESKVSLGVGDLSCTSNDSLFGDVVGLTDSVMESMPVMCSPNKQWSPPRFEKVAPIEGKEITPSTTNKNLPDNSPGKEIRTIDYFAIKAHSDFQLESNISGTKHKRKSIEFRAVSGSQLSFEEDEANTVAELILSPSAHQKPIPTHQSPVITQKLKSDRHAGSGQAKEAVVPMIPACPKTRLSTPAAFRARRSGVTPISARARLLRDRLRKTTIPRPIFSLPGTTTLGKGVDSPAARATRLRAELVEKALKAAVREQTAAASDHALEPFYGLPTKVSQMFQQHRGISSLYEWQKECLLLGAVREGRNLIYSLPTSGGKTLVAEVLMLRELLCKQKDALFILPFVAIVQEKVKTLSPFALDLDFVVEEYAASKGAMPPRVRLKRRAIYIATIEKAASLVNSLIEAGRVNELGMVVIDELHMLGEGGSRGAILEMTLAKLMHTADENFKPTARTQLIGMSATLNNISDLSKFLQAEVYSNDFRPVELREFVKIEDMIYEIDAKALCPDDRLKHTRICTYKYDTAMRKADPDLIMGLVQEVIPAHSCLIFCSTKKNCENVAQLLCKLLPKSLTTVKRPARESLMKVLRQEGGGDVCPVLRRTVPYGIAYHHSGLTMDERRLIEEAYLEGVLCLLTCTSTLAAGVNLPAKRVILRAPKVAANFLSRSQYKQMVGRAGRAGLDSSGESILMLEKKDKAMLLDLVSGPCDVCNSSLLYENHKGLRHLLLTTIGLKITTTLASVSTFLQRTLCYVQSSLEAGTDLLGAAQSALQGLVDLDLINQTMEEVMDPAGVTLASTQYTLDVTKLGRAVYKGSIDIDRGPQLYADLLQAQGSLVVSNYLHLLYLVTPYDLAGAVRPDWMTYLDQISKLEDHEMKVLRLIGLSESYISKKASGQRVRKGSMLMVFMMCSLARLLAFQLGFHAINMGVDLGVDDAVLGRFYVTLILYNLWQQRSIWEVAELFRIPRGLVQNILNLASTFAACISHFCQELEEFWAYQDLFANFVKKLSFCFMTDLIPLLEIPGIKMGRARQLFNAGYKNLQQVAHAEPSVLVRTLEHMSMKVATVIITAAKVLLNERVEALQEEAQAMISAPSDMPPGGHKRT